MRFYGCCEKAQNVERRALRRYRRNSTKPKRQKCKAHKRRHCEECHQEPTSRTSDDWALSLTDERNLLTIRDHLIQDHHFTKDSCINSTKVLIGIGSHFGVEIESCSCWGLQSHCYKTFPRT